MNMSDSQEGPAAKSALPLTRDWPPDPNIVQMFGDHLACLLLTGKATAETLKGEKRYKDASCF
jgi:hypothetical protein